MAEINFDIAKYKAYAEDVKKNIDDFNILANNFYKRIQEIPTKTGEWYGKSALKFTSAIAPEVEEINDFVNKLYAFGNLMIDYCDKMAELEKNNKVGDNR